MTQHKSTLAAIFLLTLAMPLPAQSPEDLFSCGEAAYHAGMLQREVANPDDRGEKQFREAASQWEQLRLSGVHNCLLLRNLGHAYFFAGDLPRAILAYRMGLAQNPNDTELRKALRLARDRVVFADGVTLGRPPEESTPWLFQPGLITLFVLSGLLYFLGCASLTRWAMLRQPRFLVAAIILLIFALGLGFLTTTRQSAIQRPIIVVAADGVLLRKGNSLAFPAWSDIPLSRGVEAEAILFRDDWYQVRLSSGEVGWLSARDVVSSRNPESSP